MFFSYILYFDLSDFLHEGILEVDQLGFSCLMTSEGSKCEKLAKSDDFESNSLKVGLKPDSSHGKHDGNKSSYQSMSLTSLDYEEELPSLVIFF